MKNMMKAANSETIILIDEFGHSLHGMFANTRFESLSGTNVWLSLIHIFGIPQDGNIARVLGCSGAI